MSDKQQTAVEWFVEQLRNNENIRWRGTPFDELFEQAKAMHKREIKDAFNQSWQLRDKPYETADKYYNETFQ
jgi:hypothetical protein